eukprot:CAMPEP_0167768312 /NCGR_PEP_ID=MMETSP0110_2-20121227/16569_1 /TAXON_ID=629695 /ORGANISM="Gymnochlora sp., Strain CCMP2014" /LENGTH=68 /DNA_ID=CAMNT_0007656915 /DNA_START=46 /DNA_END=252 /DNA_ORIENTATION=-
MSATPSARELFNYAKKIWMKPVHRPFLIGWGVTVAIAYLTPVSEEQRMESAMYRRYYIKTGKVKEDHH